MVDLTDQVCVEFLVASICVCGVCVCLSHLIFLSNKISNLNFCTLEYFVAGYLYTCEMSEMSFD